MNNIHDNLLTGNSVYRELLSRYMGSDEYNLSLDFDDSKVRVGSLANTQISQQISIIKQGNRVISRRITGARAESYYGEKTTRDTDEEVSEGKTFSVEYERTTIGLVKSMLHEAVHAKIGTTSVNDDENHDNYSINQGKILAGLKEYNTENNLGYSDNDLEVLSWEGSQKSNAFNSYIACMAEKNNESFSMSKVRWYLHNRSVSWSEKSREEKSNVQ
jgi:hypothetical protein